MAAIDRATGIHRWQLAQGHALYGDARKLHEQQDYEHAGPGFERAAVDLEDGGSPFALWPRLYLAIEEYHAPDLPKALARLRTLGTLYEPERYAIFDGYVHWIRYLVLGRSGPAPISLPDCEIAARRFRQAGELENGVAMENSVAEALGQSGDLEGAWQHLGLAFAERGSLGTGRHAENTLWVAIDTLRAGDQPAAALPLVDEYLEEAERRGNALGLSLALRKQGELLTDLGASERALTAHLDRAQEVGESIPDAALRKVVESEALIARGRGRCTSDPVSGIDDFDRAERFVLASGYHHLQIQILAGRGRCRQALGDAVGAEADLAQALSEVEAQRGLIHDPDLRTFYLDQARAVLESRVGLALARGDGEGAFATVERLRAPVLLETMSAALPGVEADGISRSLPQGTALVELLSLRARSSRGSLRRGDLPRPDPASATAARGGRPDPPPSDRTRRVATLLGHREAVWSQPCCRRLEHPAQRSWSPTAPCSRCLSQP